MTDATAEGAGARRGRIGLMPLLTGVIARLLANAVPLVMLMVVLAMIQLGLQEARDWAGVKRPSLGGEVAPYLAFVVAANLIAAIADAAALILLVRGRDGLRRLDRGIVSCAAVMFLLAMTYSVQAFVVGAASADRSRVVETMAANTVVGLGLGYLQIRLMLWPVALAAGRSDLGPVRSWIATRGVTLSAILAIVVILLPIVIASAGMTYALVTTSQLEHGPLAQRALQLTAGQVTRLAALALAVTVYALRVAAPAKVADLFD